MDSPRLHTPPSWTTRSTSPRPIPSASPRLVPITSTVNSEWQKLRIRIANPQDCCNYFTHVPRNLSRSHTPPSLSPSPAPSPGSYYTDHYDDVDDFEIEEIEDDDDGDSGVELLVGEYEEPSPDYRNNMYDSDEYEESRLETEIVHSFGMLSAGVPSPIAQAMAQRQHKFGAPARKAKRSYTESVGNSDSDYDSGLDSQSSERRTRRRVIRQRDGSVEAVSVGTLYAGSPTSDYEVDMEL
ncbi:hypothetical protein L873DRAFT_1685793 [Choiromyces venosus 120613-1]|uniref:Uncharacterized protein n=1 Tax=Choiromyces venosus 120613-1 TaxID=1336337 RepID=A0A3N4JRN3_9PEZI|nr:hypothetical protein L873DRAFT_1685793 [Choiromyces venosus 120613-1]